MRISGPALFIPGFLFIFVLDGLTGVMAALGTGWTLIPLALLDVCHR